MAEAERMIGRCKQLGLFAAKFQLFTEKEAPNLPKHLYLTKEDARRLFEVGKNVGQEVFFTCMFPKAVDWCEEIGVSYYKIRYKDQYNIKMIKKIPEHKRCFISQDFPYINTHFIPLFCIPKYPSSYLDYMTPTNPYYRNFGFKGVSDHTFDFELFLKHSEGYEYWEKHVKLDGTIPLEDKWSVSFSELEEILK